MLNRWLLATAGVLVFTFVLGLWMGTVLFSDLTVSAKLENLTAAVDVAPTRTTPNVPDKASVVPEPARVTRPPTTPSGGDSPPAVTAAAATPTGKEQRLRAPLTATKPVIRAATVRHRHQPQRTASKAKPVPRAPAADTRTATVRAVVTAPPAPALPRFHGSLAIHSEPRGALVWVDGQIVGPTPVLLKGVRAGSRVVRIESEGYERWSSAARVVADQNTAIVATLQRH